MMEVKRATSYKLQDPLILAADNIAMARRHIVDIEAEQEALKTRLKQAEAEVCDLKRRLQKTIDDHEVWKHHEALLTRKYDALDAAK